MHTKRIATPRSWPIPKTGTKYVVSAYPGRRARYSIPLLIALRDMLKLGDTRNEVHKILSAKGVTVNGKQAFDDKLPVGIFDVITIIGLDKTYRIIFNGKKIALEETKHKDQKTCKVLGKTMLPGKKIQLNLLGGSNVLSNEKAKVNDSVIVSFKDGKILKVLPLKESAQAYIIGGSHLGESGKIEKVEGKNAIVKIEKMPVTISLSNILVVE